MIHLGVTDTNWISHQFVTVVLEMDAYDPTAAYSRGLTAAQELGPRHEGVEYITDLETFSGIAHMDAAYIASPNSLHFEQAKQAVLVKKNIIVEKSTFSTPDEMAEAIGLANKNRVYLSKVTHSAHRQSFQKTIELLPLKSQILGANFTCTKYPFRYDQVLEGKGPNIFSPCFSGGALADLDVYLVYVTLGWFGVPNEGHHSASRTTIGVDDLGTIVLRYDQSDVTLNTGKVSNPFTPSGIYFENGTLILGSVNATFSAEHHDCAHEERDALDIQVVDNPMIEKARDFAAVLNNPVDKYWDTRYEGWAELTRDINEVVINLHHSAGITLGADK